MRKSALLFLFLSLTLPALAGQGVRKSQLNQAETRLLVQAIQDEIYDYEYQQYFFPEGGPVGEVISSSKTRVPLYLNPVINARQGQVIYKLLPYGEIRRSFHIQSNGTVVLDGDPELGFPASQPNRKTVYLKDDDLCRMKHEWIMSSFDIDLSPGQNRVQDAARRQKERVGFSKWQFAHSQEQKEH